MTLRSSYGELVPILVVAPAFFLFLLCQLLIFVLSSFFLFSRECDVTQLGQSLCSKALIHFSYLPMATSREFLFIFNDVEAMIERLENISCFIKALAYCELLIMFRYTEKATKVWPIYRLIIMRS